MQIKSILLFIFIFLPSAYADDVLIDVTELVGKSKAEVSSLIGDATSCSPSRHGETCQFVKAETEIVFIQGKADWITIEGLDDQPFNDATIELLGFNSQRPTFSNTFTKRWEPVQGLLSVSLFKGASNADYAYIKAYTE